MGVLAKLGSNLLDSQSCPLKPKGSKHDLFPTSNMKQRVASLIFRGGFSATGSFYFLCFFELFALDAGNKSF